MKGKNKISKVKKAIIIVVFILIVLIIAFKTISFFNNYNKIYLTNKEFKHDSEYTYILDSSIKTINGKINTLDKIKNTNIKVYAGKLIFSEKNFEKKKNWKIDIDSLNLGINTVEITIDFENGNKDTRTICIYNTSKENTENLDTNDTDGDGLLNYQEDILGTNKNKKDTDNDGISDYDEIYSTSTDPSKYDTDENSTSDGDEDFDKDGLSNIDEVKYKTNAFNNDSDSDKLSDYDEVKKYSTDPNNDDTDSDGIKDGIEVKAGFNPKEINETISVTQSSKDKKVAVKLPNITGQQLESFNAEESANFLNLKESDSYISGPYNFSIDGKIENAIISFEFDTSKIDSNAKPTIYYCNKETHEIEELNTNIENNKASTVVNHFSEYILLDKNAINNKINNAPKVDGSNVTKESLSTDEYIVFTIPILNLLGEPIYI